MRIRNAITAAAARPDGTVDLKISARHEAGSWRVEVGKTER